MAVTQDQVYIRALAVDFFISLLNTVEAWAQRTLDEIESWDDLSPDGKNERALEKLRKRPAPTPGYNAGTSPHSASKGVAARDNVLRLRQDGGFGHRGRTLRPEPDRPRVDRPREPSLRPTRSGSTWTCCE